MLSDELMRATRRLLDVAESEEDSEIYLRRVISAAYYAMFHRLAESCARFMAGEHDAADNAGEWLQVYRALDHGAIRNRTGNGKNLDDFSDGTQIFVTVLLKLQGRRSEADYNPRATFGALDVEDDVRNAEDAMAAFDGIGDREKWNLAIRLLINARISR